MRESLARGHGDGLEGAGGDFFAQGEREKAAEPLGDLPEEASGGGGPGFAEADEPGLAKARGEEGLADFPAGPFLEVEADEFGAEDGGDVMGAGEAVGGVKDVPAAGLEEAADEVEVGADVVGVEVLEELVAEGDVGDGVGEGEVVAVVNDEFEVGGRGLAGGALVGDVHADDMAGGGGGAEAEAAVAGSELDEGAALGEEGAEEAHLAVHLAPAFLGGLAAGEAGVIRDALEELAVEGLEKSGAFLPGTGAEPGGELFFDLVMVAQALGAARGRVHG